MPTPTARASKLAFFGQLKMQSPADLLCRLLLGSLAGAYLCGASEALRGSLKHRQLQ